VSFVGSQPSHLPSLTKSGNASVIYQFAGRDASREYNEVHAPSLISATLKAEEQIGDLDKSTLTTAWAASSSSSSTSTVPLPPATTTDRPPLSSIINLYDFEEVARRTLTEKSYAYISSGSNDNLTRDANDTLLKRILLRPSVMRDVSAVRTSTTLFGAALAMPIYICPMGQGRTGGPEGEPALARAAAAAGAIHCIATPASYPHDDILAATPRHALFQLYVNKDRRLTEAAVRRVTASGKVRALVVTADLAVVSKREADERARPDGALARNTNTGVAAAGKGGLARETGSFIDPALSWADLAWLRSLTDLPLLVKGIQRADDAVAALRAGCDGIVVSNHGGRAADGAPPAILTLLELHRCCPEVFANMEVLVDGGFRRGSDVVKAICLGASAVGIGRPLMYALGYGQDGVEHALASTSILSLSLFISFCRWFYCSWCLLDEK